MVRKALILIPLALLYGCKTTDAQLHAAAVTAGQAAAHFDFPDLPEACTAHVVPVIPKVGEKARWTQARWEITTRNRDDQADDCAAWGVSAKTKYAGTR